MVEAYRILNSFGDRLTQVHISEVSTSSGHDRISFGAELAFRTVAELIPEAVPIIIESRISAEAIGREMLTAASALPITGEALRAIA